MLKLKKNSIFKFISSLFCAIGLLYPTIELVTHYLEGKTLVNIKVERIFNDTLPAITICFTISFKKIATLNEKYDQLFKTYRDILSNTTITYSDLITNYNNLKKDLNGEIDNGNINFIEILQNYSIGLHDNFNNKRIKIMFEQNMNIYAIEEVYGDQETEIIETPIESHDMMGKGPEGTWFPGKGLSFFSALRKKWRHYKKRFNFLKIIIKYDRLDFPIYGNQNVFMALHSQNSFPEMLSSGAFENIRLNKTYMLKYDHITTEILDSNCETNCYEYDLDYKYGNYNMRSDCIIWCYQRKMAELCKSHSIYETDDVFRTEAVHFFNNMTYYIYNQNNSEVYHKVKLSCIEECRKDCYFKYYSFQLKEIKNSIDTDHILVYISHNNQLDFIIKHSPEMTFISFISNLGGYSRIFTRLLLIFLDQNKLN